MKSLQAHTQSSLLALLAPRRHSINHVTLNWHNESGAKISCAGSGFARRLSCLLLFALLCLALTLQSAPANLSRKGGSPPLAMPPAISCSGTDDDAVIRLHGNGGYFAFTVSSSSICASTIKVIEDLIGTQDLTSTRVMVQGETTLYGCYWPSSTSNNLTITDIQLPPQYLKTDTGDTYTMTITKVGNATGDFNQTSGLMNLNMPVSIQLVSTDPDLNLGSACKFTTTLHLTTEGTGGKRYLVSNQPDVTLVDAKVMPVAASNMNCGDKTAIVNAMLAAVNSNCLMLSTSLGFNLTFGTQTLKETESNDNATTSADQIVPSVTSITGEIKYGDIDEFYTTYTLETGRTITVTHKVIETQAKSEGSTCTVKGTTTSYTGPFVNASFKDYKTQKSLTASGGSTTKTKLPAEPPESEDGCTLTTTKYEYVKVTSYKNTSSQPIQMGIRLMYSPPPVSGPLVSNGYQVAISFN